MVLTPVVVIYCGACGMPPEFCSYGPDFESHCAPWLRENHPHLYQQLHKNGGKKEEDGDGENTEDVPTAPWTTEERLTAFYTKYVPEKLDNVPALLEKYQGKEDKLFTALIKKYGEEPLDPYYTTHNDSDSEDLDNTETDLSSLSLHDKKKRRGASAKTVHKIDTRIVIQKISRNKKKAVTIVVGMDTVPNIKLKDVSKAFSKRFAGSSSVKDTPSGNKEIIIQGDHTDDVASMIVTKFNVQPENVFLDIDGEFVPFK